METLGAGVVGWTGRDPLAMIALLLVFFHHVPVRGADVPSREIEGIASQQDVSAPGDEDEDDAAASPSPFTPQWSLEVVTGAEYDDNVNLFTQMEIPTGESPESDFVWFVSPEIEARVGYRDHSFSLGLTSDYRQTKRSGFGGLNFSSTAGADLQFPKGLNITLSETYTQTDFDQALHEEAGIPNNLMNVIQVGALYVPKNRLKVAASYERQEQIFDIPGGKVNRNIDSGKFSLTVPITRTMVSNVSYVLRDQASPERPDRVIAGERYTAGARWQGPNRFTLWFDGGRETIDFESTPATDFANGIVFEFGAEVHLTELLDGSLTLGRDGFGEPTYEGNLSYRNDPDFNASLSFSEKTETSFSFVFADKVLRARRIDLVLDKYNLWERIFVSMGIAYQYQESVFSEEERDDRVLSGTVQMGYAIDDRFRLGVRYQYSKRSATIDSFIFTNRRYGLVATILWR
jgi:hypothetical protein